MATIKYAGRPKVTEVVKLPPNKILHQVAHPIVELQEGATLYLGPVISAQPSAWPQIQQFGVKAILNCTKECDNYFEHKTDPKIAYCRVDVLDREETQIHIYFQIATQFIHDHLSSGSSVLVHCAMGISRSTTMVIAYLIRFHNMSRDNAYLLIKSRRQIVEPKQTFWHQLEMWEKLCTGQLGSNKSKEKNNGNVANSTESSASASTSEQVVTSINAEWAARSNAAFQTGWAREYFDELGNTISKNDVDTLAAVALDFVCGRGSGTREVQWLKVRIDWAFFCCCCILKISFLTC